MKKTTIVIAVLLALISVGAFAQPGPPLNPDPDPGGNGGGGSCYTCTIASGQAFCIPQYWDNYWAQNPVGADFLVGASSCTAHNVPPGSQGPPFCQMAGSCIYNAGGTSASALFELQALAIVAFLRESKLVTDTAVDDFIAATDYALRDEPYDIAARKRLDAYRAKFAALAGLELKPGHVPVMPHKLTKTPAAIFAVR